jgi:hypothetical protein
MWHIPLLCVQWKTPDDGQRNCPKHVDFHSKNKFEKSVHLVGFIIRNEFFYLYGGVKHPPNRRTGKEQNKNVGKTIWVSGCGSMCSSCGINVDRGKAQKWEIYGFIRIITIELKILHMTVSFHQFILLYYKQNNNNNNIIVVEAKPTTCKDIYTVCCCHKKRIL